MIRAIIVLWSAEEIQENTCSSAIELLYHYPDKLKNEIRTRIYKGNETSVTASSTVATFQSHVTFTSSVAFFRLSCVAT